MKITFLNPRSLSKKEKEAIGEECHPIAVDAFGTKITFEDVVSHVTDVDILSLLHNPKKKLLAFGSFAALKICDKNICQK